MINFFKAKNAVLMTLLIMSSKTLYGICENPYSSENCGKDTITTINYGYTAVCDICEPTPEPCCPQSCGRLYFGGAALYLRAFEGGLSSACDGTEITTTTEDGLIISRLEGRAHDPNFKWNLGYRVELGYEFANSCCDIGVIWTHYDSHSQSHGDASQHNWNIDFNVVDLVYGCDYNCSPCFAVTPFGGIRYAAINQNLHVEFSNLVDGAISSSLTGRLKEDFVGIGPLIGLEADWNMGCGFSLYGGISVAALYGTFHVRSQQSEQFPIGINIDHTRKNVQACQTVVDAEFGIQWETTFCCDKCLFVRLGVEQHRYFNFNQFCGYGDLNIDGVCLGLGVNY